MTPSETETLKMFEERFQDFYFQKETFDAHNPMLRSDDVKEFVLSEIRLARAEERKQAYEDGEEEDGDSCTELNNLSTKMKNTMPNDFKKRLLGASFILLLGFVGVWLTLAATHNLNGSPKEINYPTGTTTLISVQPDY
jgi:hypothetical protein